MDAQAMGRKWDNQYRNTDAALWPATEVLRQNLHLLPNRGTALDLACGLGANAILLAQHGMQTHAWDLSQVAIERLTRRAVQLNVSVQAQMKEVNEASLPENYFSVIVVAHFLERALAPCIMRSLKNNGLLFYQTFIEQKTSARGPTKRNFLLRRNELLQLFAPLHILVYREEGLVGDSGQGFRDQAMLIGQK